MAKNRIKLSICGCELALCSEEDEADIRSVGDEVQKAVDGMMEKNERLSVTMAAIIAALDYCDAAHKASASADNLRTQIKNYLEDSSHARMDAEESHRELERVRRENQTLRARLAAVGDTGETAPAAKPAAPGAEAAAPEAAYPPREAAAEEARAKEKEKAEQESFMSFFEKKADEP